MDATKLTYNEMDSGFTRFMGLKRCTRVSRAINAIMEHEIALGNKPTFWCSASYGSVTIRIYPNGPLGEEQEKWYVSECCPKWNGTAWDFRKMSEVCNIALEQVEAWAASIQKLRVNCSPPLAYTRFMDAKVKNVRNFVAIAMEKRWGKKSNVHRHRADRRPKDARRHWSREEGLHNGNRRRSGHQRSEVPVEWEGGRCRALGSPRAGRGRALG